MSTPPPAPSRSAHPRSRLVLVVAWLLAAVLAGTVAWWAVTAVGRERGAQSAGLVSQAQVEAELAQRAGGEPTATPGSTGTPAPTPPADPAPPASGATAPDPTAAPPAEPAPAAPAPAEPPATAPAPAGPVEVARTWDVSGGQVAAVCTGSTIALLYATPAGGWGVEVEHAGPAEVEVEFRSGDDETRLRAECIGGTPELTRDESGGGSDDGGGRGGRDDRGGDDD